MIWCIGCYYWMMNRAAAWLCPETSLLQPAGMIYLDSGYLKNHGVVLQSSMWGRSCLLCFPVLSWSTSLKEDGTGERCYRHILISLFFARLPLTYFQSTEKKQILLWPISHV
jgi:hypothetical protein